MPVYFAIFLFCLGILIIAKGSDVFVEASVKVSDITGVSRAVIGATLVSFATTSPEFFVSTLAVAKGYNDLSVGNAVGSLSANIGIAFALSAFFTPGPVNDNRFGLKGLIMISSAAFLFLFCINGKLSRIEGAILFFVFAVSVYVNIRSSKNKEEIIERQKTNRREIVTVILKFSLGAAAVLIGSNLITDNGKFLASYWGVPDAIIGLTVVAIGTSLPEIVTSVTAIIKKQSALAIGNVFGANILDSTLILATGAFISGGNLPVSRITVTTDLPVVLILSAAAVIPAVIAKKTYRFQGVLIMAAYISYLVYITLF
ncbi:MAG: calcium/sodium antiporter [Oscillospiraceae bacterium]|nr:calcium/sodium antiporter [Oscillospiraceae bacterium]